MILVAGPYRSGTNDDPALIARNVAAMTEAALRLFRAGHLPVMGEWYALPLIEHAGSTGIGDALFNEIFHPVSRRLVQMRRLLAYRWRLGRGGRNGCTGQAARQGHVLLARRNTRCVIDSNKPG
jgi:hypothetical protein